MEEKEMYTIQELFDNLDVPYVKLGKLADMSEGTITRIRDGYPARRTTLNRLLKAFSQVYNRTLTLENVAGVKIEDKHKPEHVKRVPIEEKPISTRVDPLPSQNRIVERSDNLVPCKDFFERQTHFQETFSESSWMRWVKSGLKVRGDGIVTFDVTELPKAGNEGKYFFSPKQAEEAIEKLKQNGKVKS